MGLPHSLFRKPFGSLLSTWDIPNIHVLLSKFFRSIIHYGFLLLTYLIHFHISTFVQVVFTLDYLFLNPYVLILKILTLKWYFVPDSSLKGHQPSWCFFPFPHWDYSTIWLFKASVLPHILLIPSKWNEAQAGFLWTNSGCRLNILLFSCTSRLTWISMFSLGSCIHFYHLPQTPLSLSGVSAISSSTTLCLQLMVTILVKLNLKLSILFSSPDILRE